MLLRRGSSHVSTVTIFTKLTLQVKTRVSSVLTEWHCAKGLESEIVKKNYLFLSKTTLKLHLSVLWNKIPHLFQITIENVWLSQSQDQTRAGSTDLRKNGHVNLHQKHMLSARGCRQSECVIKCFSKHDPDLPGRITLRSWKLENQWNRFLRSAKCDKLVCSNFQEC